MALIPCPNCGSQVSDKASKCVHCGYDLFIPQTRTCPECGSVLSEGDVSCPNCGCPVDTNVSVNQNPQQVELTKVSVKPAVSKKFIIISLIAILSFAAIFAGVKKYQEQKRIEQAAQASLEYGEKYETVTYLMLSGCADAETCGNLIHSVWSNAIYEKNSAETNKYTKNKYGSYVDFNDALANLFADEDFIEQIDAIKQNREKVASYMKEMKNPPDDWKDAYEDLEAFHDGYLKFTNLVIDPNGSLKSFSSDFSEADNNSINLYEKVTLNFN